MKCQTPHKVRKVTEQGDNSTDKLEDAGDASTGNDDLLYIETIHTGYDGSDF